MKIATDGPDAGRQSRTTAMKKISVVTPCFNEEDNVRACYDAVRQLFENELKGYAREHIFCDNASTDTTVEILRNIAENDPDVRVIVNARNFGPFRSNLNGVRNTTGDAVLMYLPADLQDPPELLPRFVELWEQGNEIVYGIRAEREEPWLMVMTRKAYYRMINALSFVDIPLNVGDFQLIDRKVVDALSDMTDRDPFPRIMTFETGFRAVGVPYTFRARARGFSKNRLHHLFSQGMTGLITSSTAPLRAALIFGALVMIGSLLFALYTAIAHTITTGSLAPPGIPTLIVALFFFAGLQLFFLGMLGEYVLAIFGQVRGRPLVYERERINFEQEKRKPARKKTPPAKD